METARKPLNVVQDEQIAMIAPAARRRNRRRALMGLVPIILAAAGGYAWLSGGRFITTDNAYVHQPLVPVSADVAGRIIEVAGMADAPVKAGQVLYRLDPEPFRIALQKAEATLDDARQRVMVLRSAHATAEAQLAAAEALAAVRQRELERQQGLLGKGVASPAALDEAMIAAQTARNQVALARDGVRAAAAALGGDPAIDTDAVPAVRAAIALRDAAARDLKTATVLAPVDGILSQTDGLNVGRYVGAGTMVASVARTDATWIEANLKETQLADLRVGQQAEVKIDAYPDLVLHGRVESIGSTTGSQLSLIPAQNATGNWVKVVQRVPVRILVETDAAHPLRGGMSAHVSVDGGRTRLESLL